MLNYLKKGQAVFLKQPLQIFATVVGPAEFAAPDGSQVYCVQLRPQTQYYRLEDLELSQSPQFAPAQQSDFYGRAQEIAERIERRAYELFESRGSAHGHDREDWMRAEAEIVRSVPVEIDETDTELIIRAEVPGFSEGTLEVQVAPQALCIAGQRPAPSGPGRGVTVYSERRTDRIFRVVDLSYPVDPQSVGLALSDGVLEITVSKSWVEQEELPALAHGAFA